MKPAYSKIKWHKNASWFNAWTNGTTGFPVVDACMRQLNTTGYMHNRGRLIVASFLVKTLLINWKEGEKYFATKLVDYDPASNNGNWQWISSSGVDSQPYFRIFNPWSQSENFDPDAIYIKKWVPELADVPAKDIHQWFHSWKDYKDSVKYYKPICEYEIQKERALKMYREIY
jgi:deoxyribodipyrimidine photo-lyase